MSTIDIRLSAIYHASHDVLPEKAAGFAEQAGVLSAAIEPIVAQTALAGHHRVGQDLADVATELFLHLRSLVRTCNDTATGLDRIADELVEVDEEAAAWFRRHARFVGDPVLPAEPAAPGV
jgi:hypothetical protein